MTSILPQILVNGIIAGALYALIALGFNLIYGTVKFFDLAYGSVLVVGGYSIFLFAKKLGLPMPFAIVLGLLVCGLLGLLFYKLVYAQLAKRKASSLILIVASLGLFTVVQAVISMFFTSQFQTLVSGVQHVYRVGGIVITKVQLLAVFVSILVYCLCRLGLRSTRFGKKVRAVSDDREVAEIMGIKTGTVIAVIFFAGSIIGGLAGMFVGFDTGIQPIMGFPLLLKGVIAAIIGGVGILEGGIIGAFVLGIIENLGIWQFSAEWKDVIAFGVLILFLVFRPQGIFNKKT